MRLQNRVCIITGGGRGLGRELALGFAREGARLVVAGTSEAALQQTAAEIQTSGQRALALPCDVSDEAAVAHLVEKTLAEFGQVDVLVNNAGAIGPTALASEVSLADWNRTLAVNLTGAFLCARAVLPHMAARRQGKIINISSIAGHQGYPLRAPYAASKWGMIGLSQTLAGEWGQHNIQVNTISPGPVRGERMDEVIRRRAESSGHSLEAVAAEYSSRLALGHFVEPDNIVALAIFFASHESDSVTGEAVKVSAGYGLI